MTGVLFPFILRVEQRVKTKTTTTIKNTTKQKTQRKTKHFLGQEGTPEGKLSCELGLSAENRLSLLLLVSRSGLCYPQHFLICIFKQRKQTELYREHPHTHH